MISEKQTKRYCNEDPTLIENYWDAVNDETTIWNCHHKNEIFRGICVSVDLLKDIGLYYGCPADELIFLTPSDHARLHAINMSKTTRKKISASNKGNQSVKGKHWNLSKDTRNKMSKAQIGNTKGKGKTHKLSAEAKRKISEAKKAYYAKMRAKQ